MRLAGETHNMTNYEIFLRCCGIWVCCWKLLSILKRLWKETSLSEVFSSTESRVANECQWRGFQMSIKPNENNYEWVNARETRKQFSIRSKISFDGSSLLLQCLVNKYFCLHVFSRFWQTTSRRMCRVKTEKHLIEKKWEYCASNMWSLRKVFDFLKQYSMSPVTILSWFSRSVISFMFH